MKVVVWGLGSHSIKNILPSIKETKNLSLYGVVSRNLKTIKKCSEDFDCLYWQDPEQMLLDDEVDIVYVSTPPGLHFDQGLKILSSGKHFWCEKPITININDFERLLKISRQANLSINEALMYVHHPHFMKLKELIGNGVLGSLTNVKCSFTLPKLMDPGYRFNKRLGGSALLDLGIYPLSIITNLFSKNEIKIGSSVIQKDEKDNTDVNGEVELIVDDSISCILDWSYNKTYKNEISFHGATGSLRTEKIFSKDSNYFPTITLNTQKKESVINIESANHFKLMLELFSSNITNGADLGLLNQSTLTLHRLIDEVFKTIP